MKTILVTGGCGFIASNFIGLLLKTGNYKVINVDKMDYCSSSMSIINEYDSINQTIKPRNLENYTFYKSNINNREFISFILKTHGVDIVYHFAAQSHVDNSFNNSLQFVEDNVVGTCNLLESCREYGKLEKFIHVSTDEVYGDVSIDECVEDGYYKPTNPYAASKASAELMCKSYAISHGLNLIITRSNNVYGAGQYWEKVIPKFIKNIYENKPCPIYGQGTALRKYLHISDACEGFYTIMVNGEVGKVYEMNSDTELSTISVLSNIINIMKPSDDTEKWIKYVPDRLFHDCRYLVNPESMNKLGWKPKIDFRTGLENTIEWYVNYAIPFSHWNDILSQ
jgi:dTDP-glucose 4,6-dehydratase